MEQLQRGYSALIIEADAAAKTRLRMALQALPAFKRVASVPDLNEATAKFREQSALGALHESYDAIFISSRLGTEEMSSFIRCSKGTKQGQDAAYILVLQASDQKSTITAQSMLHGADGFLCEPFSVDALANIVALSERIKKERARSRERAAIALLVKEIIPQLDAVAAARWRGEEALISMKALRETCAVLQSLDSEGQSCYFEIVAELLQEARPRPAVRYRGASQRVKSWLLSRTPGESSKKAS